ncbi:MAG: transglutaminase domain-containing protein [Sedimenticola sp.]
MTLLRTPWGFIIVMSVFVVTLFYLSWSLPVEKQDDLTSSYPIERNIRYSYQLKNISGTFLKEAEFWTHVPVKQTSSQQTRNIHSTAAYKLESDVEGNQRLIYTVKNIPPYGTKTITINVKLAMSDKPNNLPSSDVKAFLKSERYVETDSPAIKALSEKLAGENSQETVASNYTWVTKNLLDEGYVKNDRGALYAINNKKGDCTEYMYLLTALNRSNGIPTRGISGFVVREDAVLRSSDYHNWTLSLVDGLWQLIDPHKEIFMTHSADYIAMRLLGGIGSNSAQTLFGGSPGLEIVMN